ncbi:hypothetical protein MMC17_007570 [Xylographa soralifera]|nr:hypothetical protein [Xylographa soralifera]
MDRYTGEVMTQRYRSYSFCFRRAVDDEAARGDDNTLIITVGTSIKAMSLRAVKFTFPFSYLSLELHDLWYTFIQAAKAFGHDNNKQDTLVWYILSIREKGTLTRTVSAPASNDVRVEIVQTSGGKMWSDLPFLVQDIRDAWKDSLNMSTSHRKSLAAFIARLAAVGVCGNALAGCALLTMRDALETPRTLVGADGHSYISVGDLLPTVNAWLLFALDKLLDLSNASFREVDPSFSALGGLAQEAQVVLEGGFSPLRWTFWKQRLEALSGCDQELVAKEAKLGLMMMETSLECPNCL